MPSVSSGFAWSTSLAQSEMTDPMPACILLLFIIYIIIAPS